jgi:hypothetical protein
MERSLNLLYTIKIFYLLKHNMVMNISVNDCTEHHLNETAMTGFSQKEGKKPKETFKLFTRYFSCETQT